MGGRVTLVNSVLNSMGIHNMMVLPIPVTITNRLVSLLSSFIWDNGEVKRRHWVGWDRVALSKDLGGLGIKNPADIQLALHGKLAWRFLQRDSLWSRFAHARFRENENGSIVWNGFRHLLENIRSESCWSIGNGDISIREMCSRLNWRYPNTVSNARVREVISSSTWNDMIEEWPWPVRLFMQNSSISAKRDTLFWMKAPDGLFRTSLFWDSFQTQGPPKPWVNRVWNSYLPTKIACFVWRVIHNAIPTDDNIAKLGILVTSRCVCCHSPSQETMEHLLYGGEWGKRLWTSLADLFDKPIAQSVEEMLHYWFEDGQDDFVSHLGTVMAAAGIWELWKGRNSVLHENRFVDWMKITLHWAAKIAFLIKKPFIDGFRNRQLLQILRISPP